jgi:hypothetical protein
MEKTGTELEAALEGNGLKQAAGRNIQDYFTYRLSSPLPMFKFCQLWNSSPIAMPPSFHRSSISILFLLLVGVLTIIPSNPQVRLTDA